MRFIGIMLTLFMLVACTNTKNPAPVLNFGVKNENKAGTHIVKSGDTVHEIASRYAISSRSLISANKLSPPYVIHKGQRLKLPPPNTYKVRPGDSLYTVSRTFGVDTTRLARKNNIKSPYRIFPGETLKIPDNYSQIIQTSSVQNTNTSSKRPKSVQKTINKVTQQAPKSSGRFSWPTRGKILSEYGPKKDGLHNDGINIAGNRGDSINVADNGVVAYTGDQIEGFGNLVLVRHENRFMTAYAHLDQILVKKGEKVSKGTVIGKMGSTGNVDRPQLHFEIRKGTKALNPRKYL